MGRWLKIGFLAGLLIVAGFFFGVICRQVGQAYTMLLAPSWELLNLLLRFLGAALALAVCAGLVATLLRPLGYVWIAFALSAVALLIGWLEFSLISGILALVYFLVGSLYAGGVARDMARRISFSESSARVGQGLFLTALALVVAGSIYASFTAHIEREGFTVPRPYIEELEQLLEGQVGSVIPEVLREEVLESFRESFTTTLDGYVGGLLEPYEGYIPVIIAVLILLLLLPILRLLSWVSGLVLSIVFAVFRSLGITRVVHETVEVQKLDLV